MYEHASINSRFLAPPLRHQHRGAFILMNMHQLALGILAFLARMEIEIRPVASSFLVSALQLHSKLFVLHKHVD